MNITIVSAILGVIAFFVTFFMARNKRTRILLAASTGIWVGLTGFLLTTFLSTNEDSSLADQTISIADTSIGLVFLIAVVLSFTLFFNDRFNSPLVHYIALFVLLFFAVLITSVIFPGNVYGPLREGIAVEILAGGVSTFLIFLTIDSFNDQDADDRHHALMEKIAKLQEQISSLENRLNSPKEPTP